jgi:hypothetical protein
MRRLYDREGYDERRSCDEEAHDVNLWIAFLLSCDEEL